MKIDASTYFANLAKMFILEVLFFASTCFGYVVYQTVAFNGQCVDDQYDPGPVLLIYFYHCGLDTFLPTLIFRVGLFMVFILIGFFPVFLAIAATGSGVWTYLLHKCSLPQ